ncbi:GNAT family N-acetyltransferase [Streptomyces sp. H10-C2]|uniref:GNAT family N-acetyltransferase n=1 Tax=unclassified Streptomyces TaxID=2593676 RepID=UPI0024BACEBC|nr:MULTISPECIES: GNAT family N-acetyltransferase [unclassified Streptomyces]MDJ0340340.1 GNAT family N-acetyltransferase [Streptomyces sp. PH10-H1]MDJ0368212.1 GNAT family N-acetyltransferase [Streptomyces sp. H10-C2]
MTGGDAASDGGPSGDRGSGLSVTMCRDPLQFAGLAEEWGRLYRRCRTATSFQTHSWLHSWWTSYGRPRRLRVLLVRQAGELIGAAPLMLAHRPLPVLVPLGGRITDFSDVLLDDGAAAIAATAMARGLRRAARGAVLDLREVRPGAAADLLYDCWQGPKRRLADSVCMELPGAPIDELITRMSTSRAQRTRAKVRKLDSMGIEEHAVPEHEVPAAVENLLRLHKLQWAGRGVTTEHVRPRFADHLKRAAQHMVASGDALVTEYRMNGEVVAADLKMLSPQLVGGYLVGADPRLRTTRVDVTTMLLRHGAGHAAGAGIGTLSLLRGNHPDKLPWCPDITANQRLLMAGPMLAPALQLQVARTAGRAWLVRVVLRHLPVVRTWRSRLNIWRAERI